MVSILWRCHGQLTNGNYDYIASLGYAFGDNFYVFQK